MLNRILEAVVARLPKRFRPYAKSILPLVATLVGCSVQWAVSGDLDAETAKTAVTGLALSGVAFLFPNVQS